MATVLRIQGISTSVNKYESIDEEVWHYNLSSVTFKHKKVHENNNYNARLKVKCNRNVNKKQNSYFSLGSTHTHVIEAQGHPSRISKYESLGEETWDFGLSTIVLKNGHVKEYRNYNSNLRIKL
jgi:hypothetical protein